MIKKIILLLISSLYLYAYELPQLKLPTDNKPEIIIFEAQSIIVKDKPSYRIRWETINATDVKVTFFGKVKLSGSVVITADEYNRGPITLVATSTNSSFVDKQILNKGAKQNVSTPMRQRQDDDYYNNSMPYRGGFTRPRRIPYRRGIY